jgi:protein-S-isoprenylcysteine O-methyltransferase Ste14
MSSSDSKFRDNPGVAAPPPLVFAGILAIGALADSYITGASLTLPAIYRYPLAIVLGCFGLIFLGGALGLFRRAGTRAEPWEPTTRIVTNGIYRVTRNPMYVGMALVYAAIAVAGGSPFALALLPVAVLVIHYGVVLREERYLQEKFGAEYLSYKARVRRWL